MNLTYRIAKGEPLTYQEGDDNTLFLDKKSTVSSLAPTATDDETKGFKVDDQWLDKVTKISYICTDATTDAAAWEVLQDNSNIVKSEVVEAGESTILNIVKISQADYNNITSPVATTLYVIAE